MDNLLKKAEKNKCKIVNRQAKRMEKYILRQFKKVIKNGLTYADIPCKASYLNYLHFDETIERVIESLTHKDFKVIYGQHHNLEYAHFHVSLNDVSREEL